MELKLPSLAKHRQRKIVIVLSCSLSCGCGSTLLKIHQTNGLLTILENNVLSINEPRGLTFDNCAKMKSKHKRAQFRILNQRSYLISSSYEA